MNIDKDIERCKELIKTEHSNWIGMTNQDAISNVLSDRETWKKIAEKLTEEHARIADLDLADRICSNCDDNYSNCSDYDQKKYKQCIIDWARKEVENGNK